MAKADLIAESIVEVEQEMLELQQLVQAFDDLAGDSSCPPWLFAVHTRVRSLQATVDELGTVVRREALPHLRDLDRATNGGMGAVATMVTKVAAGQLSPSRT